MPSVPNPVVASACTPELSAHRTTKKRGRGETSRHPLPQRGPVRTAVRPWWDAAAPGPSSALRSARTLLQPRRTLSGFLPRAKTGHAPSVRPGSHPRPGRASSVLGVAASSIRTENAPKRRRRNDARSDSPAKPAMVLSRPTLTAERSTAHQHASGACMRRATGNATRTTCASISMGSARRTTLSFWNPKAASARSVAATSGPEKVTRRTSTTAMPRGTFAEFSAGTAIMDSACSSMTRSGCVRQRITSNVRGRRRDVTRRAA